MTRNDYVKTPVGHWIQLNTFDNRFTLGVTDSYDNAHAEVTLTKNDLKKVYEMIGRFLEDEND